MPGHEHQIATGHLWLPDRGCQIRANLNGGLGWLEVECKRCKTRASLPLADIRRPLDTPIWKLEASLKCRSCKKGRYAPPVHMIKLTETREITPYLWVHRRRGEATGSRPRVVVCASKIRTLQLRVSA